MFTTQIRPLMSSVTRDLLTHMPSGRIFFSMGKALPPLPSALHKGRDLLRLAARRDSLELVGWFVSMMPSLRYGLGPLLRRGSYMFSNGQVAKAS